jgi:flagellar hook protein FlgE
MSFQQGLSGLNASAKALDTIGNNIANSGTVGFKTSTAQFADVFAASLVGGGASPIGLGAKLSDVAQQFTQGNITVTNNSLDLAINGGGFFMVQSAAGDTLYSRNGQFQLDRDGYIVNASGQRLMGYSAAATGGSVSALQLFSSASNADAAPQATGGSTGATGVEANVNVDSREAAIPAATVFNYQNASTYNKATSATVYDSLGNPHSMELYFRKTGAGTWNVYTGIDNAAPGAATALTFDTSGQLTIPATGIIGQSFAVTSGATTPLVFDLNLTGSTQYGSTFTVNSLLQDGYASGKLAGFSIGADGTILGRYTNGQTRELGEVALASFPNSQGLQPLGNNTWQPTSDAGPLSIGIPGSSGSYGALQSAALEDSNVDLTAELVSMITQQRMYQANAQTIKTQDSILQTLVSLR